MVEAVCAVCLGPLTTIEEMKRLVCDKCEEKRRLHELKNEKKVFQWVGKLSNNLELPLDEYIGKDIKIEIYELS